MNEKNFAGYSPNQGKPIPIGQAKAEHAQWEERTRSAGLPGSFTVPTHLIIGALEVYREAGAGICFCNGLDAKGNYAPVMALVAPEGKTLFAFNTKEPISIEECAECQENWVKEKGEEVLRNFFVGTNPLINYLVQHPSNTVTASFIVDEEGLNSGALIADPDPGTDEDDPGEALNFARPCPPYCN